MQSQLTLRGIIIGIVGCAVITASSVFVALKLGALPWPIIFAAIVSYFLLKVMGRGKVSLNEANVTHTIMSSGAMVAGGLAFTIPGAWMLGFANDITIEQMFAISICGSALGLVASIALRRHFVKDAALEFPIGQAAAQTLVAADKQGSVGVKLFGTLGVSAAYAFFRDGIHLLPSLFFSGTQFAIYNSPMMAAVGFMVGKKLVVAWIIGAICALLFGASYGFLIHATSFPLFAQYSASTIISTLGMGLMVGAGIGVITLDVIPKTVSSIKSNNVQMFDKLKSRKLVYFAVLILVSIVIVVSFLASLPVWVAVVAVALGFLACSMSAQSVGQTGIDPMEIFGLIVLLVISVVAQIDAVKLFLIAALVAVACGLAGDVMSDFKAGAMLNTNPRAQWVGQAIGAFVGCIVAVFVMQVLLSAYGPESFGPGKDFVAAQASVVANLVGGLELPWLFAAGIIVGTIIHALRLPAMMFGLGVYLPFYLSATAAIGLVIKAICDYVSKMHRSRNKSTSNANANDDSDDSEIVVASGIIGGESILGIILAIASSCLMLFS